MDTFCSLIKREYMVRVNRNPHYSLRSFARLLGMNHATLSSMLSGKRKITQTSMAKMSQALGLSPSEIGQYIRESNRSAKYYEIQSDAFSIMSEWYFDAILEITQVKTIPFDATSIAHELGLTTVQTQLAIDALLRLNLIKRSKANQYTLEYQNSTNILDQDFTSAAHRKYQKGVLEKSVIALETIDKKNRDHTSTTLAIDQRDLPKAKEIIKKFRYELTKLLQNKSTKPNAVYQLQVSLFPLTKLKNQEK